MNNIKEFKEAIFLEGEVYDAYSLLIDIFKQATKKILIIDSYVDKTVFEMLDYKNKDVDVTIITNKFKSQLNLKKINKQYPNSI